MAFGVPPMLLGLPGDATYANYREANRALWRLTVHASEAPHEINNHTSEDGEGILRTMASTLRSEEHTSELQSLMRISYAVFCLKQKKKIYHSYTSYKYC